MSTAIDTLNTGAPPPKTTVLDGSRRVLEPWVAETVGEPKTSMDLCGCAVRNWTGGAPEEWTYLEAEIPGRGWTHMRGRGAPTLRDPSRERPPPSEPRALSLVEEQLKLMRPQLEVTLKDTGIPVASFEVAVLQCTLQEPDLQRCTPASLAEAILACARLGLMPGGIENHVALVVRHEGGVYTAECMAMVNGLVYVALRDGGAVDIDAETIRKGETYKFSKLDKSFEHEFAFPRADEIIAVYAFAEMKDGRRITEVMDVAEVDAAEAMSRGHNVAWKTHRPRMAIKSVKKRLILSRGLLSRATAEALARVRVEMDVPATAAPLAVAPSQPTTGAAAPASEPRAGMSPAASKLLGKIQGDAAKREESAEGATASKPADPPPAPSSSKPAAGKASGSKPAATGKAPSSPKSKTKGAARK